MKKAIFAYFGWDAPVRQRMELIRRAGFDSVMLWWGNNLQEIEEQLACCERCGLEICNAHLPFEDCNRLWLPGADGDACADRLCAALAECGEFHIPVAVIHLSRSPQPPAPNEPGLARLRRIAEAARQAGVKPALENLRSLPHLKRALGDPGLSDVGFCWDTGHHHYMSPERNLLADYGSRLAALHLNDNCGDADTHLLPFDGTSDWTAVTAALAHLGFNGTLSLEVQMDRSERYAQCSPEEFLTRAMASVCRLEQLIERKKKIYEYLGKTVSVKIDRPMGYVHQKASYCLTYPLNYGYIEGVYVQGVAKPLTAFTGRAAAVVHRADDVEDKLIAVPEGSVLTRAEAQEAVRFAEQYYDSRIEMAGEGANQA